MRLYSYRGISYTVAPPSVCSKLNSVEQSSPEQTIEQDIFVTLPQTQTPTAAIPMMYRGVLHLLECFHAPRTASKQDSIETFSDESVESTESASSMDES